MELINKTMILLIIQTILLMVALWSTLGYVNTMLSFIKLTDDNSQQFINKITKKSVQFVWITSITWTLFHLSVKVSEYL